MKRLILLRNLFIAFMTIGGAWIVLLIWLCSLTGCSTIKKDTRRAYKIHYRNPLVLTKYCAENYKCLDSVREIERFIQGEDVVFTDTVFEVTQSLDTVYLTRVVTKTINRTDTVYKDRFEANTDKAPIRLMQDSINKRDKEINSQKTSIALLEKKVSNKNTELWFWRILVAVFIIYKIARVYLKKQTGL